MISDRINSIFFSCLWVITPALVTVSSFFFFVQVQKGTFRSSSDPTCCDVS